MKTIIFLLLTTISITSFSQTEFEKGYLINNNGQRINCYIKDNDWKNNPAKVNYRIGESGETKVADLKNTKAFGIGNKVAYVRAVVDIDYSSGDVATLSQKRDPELKTDTVFLKTLIKGVASLYYYENGSLIRYFYSTSSKPIEQLIYKEYINGNKGIFKNRDFTAQLWENVRCSETSINIIKTIQYKAQDLSDYFRNYNACVNKAYTDYTLSEKKKLFSLTFAPGVERGSMSIDSRETNLIDVDFGSKFNYRIGLELNMLLPFNHYRWSIFMEPTYQQYSGHEIIERTYYLPRDVNAEYKSLEIPMGLKYHFQLNKKTFLFLRGGLVVDIPFSSTITYTNEDRLYKILSGNSFIAGIGVQHNRFSSEFRYYGNRDILSSSMSWDTKYSKLSFILGYRIF
jgi:hypothetical protein